jgi:hypothetical protein
MSRPSPIAVESHVHTPATDEAVASDEARLLAKAREYPALIRLEECSLETMRELTAMQGVDFATALLFDRISQCGRHRAFIERIDTRRHTGRERTKPAVENQTDAMLLIVPGAYYREFPGFGGDGRLLREVAEPMGFRVELIPLPSTAPLAVSAAQINEHLRRHSDHHGGHIVLASLSKGSADVKAALLREDAAEAFSRVTTWLDLSGVSHGTPLATRMVDSIPLSAVGRLWFWMRGYEWQMMRDLADHPASLLRGPARVPPHVRTIHLLGLPLTAHVTTRMARRDHRRLSKLGPNDGCAMLAHAAHWPGDIYPVWGADHYLKPHGAPDKMRSLAAAVLSEIAASLHCETGRGVC